MKDNEPESAVSGLTGFEIAVIGMSGKFPGSDNIEEFWDNLKNGMEGISFYSDEELQEFGVADKSLNNPQYVKGYGWLEEIFFFDAGFFGYTPLEAEIMDPQVRLFHQCGYEALEEAGYDASSCKKLIGIYAGASASFDWQARVELSGKAKIFGWFAAKQLTDKDFLCTRIAYKLGLKGPAVTVDTACSTSLTAIHLACQGLISGDCDMALAGGVTVPMFIRSGYLYREGMVNASDGHCRAFDARADGSNFGNAVAIVVLKRYTDAAADGDNVYAMIKGSAINNDGDRKAAYTAPSVDGQSNVIRTALGMAEVDPETITYVETHGTGTALGDPVEIEGLKAAFNTTKKHFCRIGSVKTNVGHLEMASGVTGLIKTVLALKHRQIPPSLFFETPNPKIDFANSPFVVNTQLTEWKPLEPGQPLRAGVSSFGIGGTNTHVVLEEAPTEIRDKVGTRGLAPLSNLQYQLILLSAKTETALEQMTQNLADHLKKNPHINMADTAYTLQVGRRLFPHRGMLVCPTHDSREAVELLLSTEPGKLRTYKSQEDNPSIIFMFSGLGGQYVNMGRDLYEHETVFREEMDRCFEILKPLVDYDPMEIFYPTLKNRSYRTNKTDNLDIHQPGVSQVAVFIFEYALARLLMAWGIKPYALIGYSFGEYAAATLSGVFDLSGALELVAARGRLLQQAPGGIMLSVPLTREEIRSYLTPGGELSLAIDNGPSCVIAGPPQAVDLLAKQMKQKKIMCMPVPGQRAIHSSMMEPIRAEFTRLFHTVTLNKPQIPYVSNVTGHWQNDENAVDPNYWARHLRETVQFAEGMKTLLKEPGTIFVEIGPGRDISTLTLRYLEGDPRAELRVLNLVRPPHQDISDIYFLLNRVGHLWLMGQPIDWSGFHGKQKSLRKRISLPTYPFEKQLYSVHDTSERKGEVLTDLQEESRPIPDYADWFYIPTWTHHVLLTPLSTDNDDQAPLYHWLIFMDGCGLGQSVLKQLKQKKYGVITLEPGREFVRTGPDSYIINPGRQDDYHRLFEELWTRPTIPTRILHLWGVTGKTAGTGDMKEFERMQETGFYSLLYTAKALGKEMFKKQFQIDVVTDQLQEVTGEELLCPAKASIIGPVRVIPQEFPGIRCRSIDVILTEPGEPVEGKENKLAEQLIEEILTEINEPLIALRGSLRWVQTFQSLRLAKTRENHLKLKEKGVYLITGGLGNIGLMLAGYLARKVKAKLILTGRSSLPRRKEWDQWLRNHGETDTVSRKILQIQNLETAGAEVRVFSVDTTDKEKMHRVITRAQKELGPIKGIIHCAGIMKGKSLGTIQQLEKKDCQEQFQPKVKGLLILEELFRDKKTQLDFFWLISSISTVLGGLGLTAYAAANSFMDAYARQQERSHPGLWISVDWDGMDVEKTQLAFERILSLGKALQVVASNGGNLQGRIHRWAKRQPLEGEKKNLNPGVKIRKPRPALMNPYIPPQGEVQQVLVNIWQNLFGYERLGIKDDFIELGGDSLKATAMIGQLHQELEVSVPLTHFFKKPDIESLAQWITSSEKQAYQSIPPVEQKEYYPLTSMQKRLYILHQLDPAAVVYNLAATLLLEGEAPREKLQECFLGLIQRHESLRTSFHMINGEPVQKIHSQVEFEIEYYDMKEVEEEEQTTEGKSGTHLSSSSVIRYLSSEFIRPFVLSRAPLLRVGLIKLLHTPTTPGDRPSQEGKEDQYLLVVDLHHIVHDGISQTILMEEFKALYAGEDLPGLSIQYKDFARWQKRELASEAMKEQEIYWLQQFSGEIPVLDLPGDFPRPMMQSFVGDVISFIIDPEKTKAIRNLALAQDATLFMVILSIYYVFLAKLSTQEDIVVGTPEAGRGHPDLQSIIGFFLHTLPLRNYPSPDKIFNHLLKQVKERTLQAFENQDYPFEKLVEHVVVNRDLSRSPLFDAMFVLHTQWASSPGNIPAENTKNMPIKSFDYEKSTSEFDLTLIGFDEGGHLLLKFEYCTKLFKAGTMSRFIDYFKTLLDNVLKDPGQRLHEIEMIPREEKHRLLYDFNDTTLEYLENKTIQQIFAEQAKKNPDQVAIVGPYVSVGVINESPQQITYGQLNQKSHQLAYSLMEKGVEPDTIVAIMIERSMEMIIGILGVLKAGGAYMPIAPDYPQERIDYMLKDSGAKVLLTGQEIAGLFSPIHPSTLLSFYPSHSSSLAYIIYTSGSTGQPKGVIVNHASIVNTLNALEQMYPFQAADVYLMKTSYLFDVSLTELFGWFWGNNGGRLVLLEPGGEKDPEKILDTMEKMKVTHINFVPSMFDPFLDFLTPGNITKLSRLKYIFLAGEALPPQLVNKFRDLSDCITLENLYGPTEAAIYASRYSLAEWGGIGNIPIGKPTQNVRLYILAPYYGLQPVGIPGELVIGGSGLARGYLNNPELTAEKIDRDLWDYLDYHDEKKEVKKTKKTYKQKNNQKLLRGVQGGGFLEKSPPGRRRQRIYHAGDLARWQPDGNIEFLGRIDHQVKIRGFRIELEEIENKLQSHHQIKKAVVVTREKKGNKFLCAYYVPADDTVGTLELKQFLEQCLPDYMVPVYFVPLETIPMTPTGKVERRHLPEPEVELPDDHIKPGTPMEKIIAETWKQVLGVDKIGVHTRFFDLGGNSVNILKVHSKLREELKADFPLMVIFRYPTVYSLAGYLSSAGMGEEQIKSTQTRQLNLEKNMMKQTLQKLGTGMG